MKNDLLRFVKGFKERTKGLIEKRGSFFSKSLTGRKGKDLSLGIDLGTGGGRYVLWNRHRNEIVQWGRIDRLLAPPEVGWKESFPQTTSPVSNATPTRTRMRDLLTEWKKKVPSDRLHSIQINLQDNSVMTGSLKLPAPAGDPKQKTDAVRRALREHLPFSLEDAVYFYRDRKVEGPAAASSQMVTFGAATREAVLNLIEDVEKKFRVTPQVHLQADSDFKLAEHLERLHAEKPVAFLNVGRSTSILTILDKGGVQFQRNLPLAGQDLTRAILSGYLKDNPPRETSYLNRAERIKKACRLVLVGERSVLPGKPLPAQSGLPLEENPEGPKENGEDNAALTQAMEGILAALIQDIRTSFEVFHKQNHTEPVSKLYLHGGGANLALFPDYLSERLGIECEKLELPAGNLVKFQDPGQAGSFQQEFTQYATALGLALEPEPLTTLTPVEYRRWRSERLGAKILRTFCASLFLTMTFAYVLFWREVTHLQELDQILIEHRQFLSRIEAPYLRMLQWKDLVDGYDKRHPTVFQTLDTISRNLPSNVLFSLISLKGRGEVWVEGSVYGDARKRAVTMSEFVNALTATGRFRNLQVPVLEERISSQSEATFRLTGEILQGEEAGGS